MPELQGPHWTEEIRKLLQRAGLPPAQDASVVDELADHLQDRYDDLRADGVEAHEAAAAVLDELRDRDRLRALVSAIRVRDGAGAASAREPIPAGAPRGPRPVDDLWRDLRYAIRMLRKAPAFTLIAVAMLAFGIGANTTVLTVINTFFLSPLPVSQPSTLVVVQTVPDGRTDQPLPLSYLNLRDVRDRAVGFSNLAAFSGPLSLTLLNGTQPERLFAEIVSGNFFETLGVQPAAGRFFTSEEDRTPGAHPVVVMTYGAWQRRFGGRADVIGGTIRLNNHLFTVIGLAPDGFKGLDAVFGPDVWIPSMMAEQVLPAQMQDWLRNRAALGFTAVARLKPGVTAAQADANLRDIGAALAQQYPEVNRGRGLRVLPLTRAVLATSGGQSATFLSLVLMAIPAFILLIACSNVANLLLARAAARRQEIAVRLALGAGRFRLIRQLLTESALLAMIGGLAGFGMAVLGIRLLWSFRPPEFAANLVDPNINLTVFVWTVVVSALTGVVFGLAPALQTSRPDLVEVIKQQTRSAGAPRRGVTLGTLLLVGQVALSLVSLIVAGLFLRSIQRAYTIDPGFEARQVGIIMISPGQAGYTRTRSEQFYEETRGRVSALPGVTAVSWATNLPLFAPPSRSIVPEGQDPGDSHDRTMTVFNTVDLDYFTAMRIPVVAGRAFAATDREGAVPVAIINETLAATYWPNRDPIGQRIALDGDDLRRQIVGVVKTVNYRSLGEAPQPCVYVPLRQHFADAMILYVHTDRDPAALMPAVQREVRAIDGQIELSDVRTMQTVIGQALFGATAGVGLLSVFGLVALALASLGLYGVMTYTVNVRRREIGLRMALGADRGTVVRLVLRQGMTLVLVGIVGGVLGALLVGRAVATMLYGVSPGDPVSIAIASLVLSVVALIACALPAYRASRLDPMSALREA
jgi:predicted permease